MVPPGSEDKVMHAYFRVGDTEVMASDGRCDGQPSFQGISLALTVPDEATADRLFAALGDGGQVQMPLARPSSRRASASSPTASASPG